MTQRAAYGPGCAAVLLAFLVPLEVQAQQATPMDANTLQILQAFRQAPPAKRGTAHNSLIKPGRNYGNCDSIALIKAAMADFGIDGVLRSPTAIPSANTDPTYSVVLRNGRSLVLTHDELDTAINDINHNSGFVAPDSGIGDSLILFKANFLYAVIAKEMLDRKDIPLYANISTFSAALDRIGDGVNVFGSSSRGEPPTDQIGILLGLTLKDVSTAAPPPSTPYLCAFKKHVVFAYGNDGDDFGTKAPLSTILSHHSNRFTRGAAQNRNPGRYVLDLSPLAALPPTP